MKMFLTSIITYANIRVIVILNLGLVNKKVFSLFPCELTKFKQRDVNVITIFSFAKSAKLI